MYSDNLNKKHKNGMMKVFLASIVSALILIGCSTAPSEIEIRTIQEELRISAPDRPRPLRLNDISFRVVSASNLEQFIQEYSDGNDRSWFMISPSDYERLALNIAELRRYIHQQEQIIVYYENLTQN